MHTHNILTILRNVIFIFGCVVFLVSGCGKQSESQSDPKVISKKIDMKQKSDTKAGSNAGIQPAKDASEEVAAGAGGNETTQEQNLETKEGETTESAEIGQTTEVEPGSGKTSLEDRKGLQETTPIPAVAIGINDAPLAYNYNPVGKIDPFASIFKEAPEPEKQETKTTEENKRIPLTPLEKISLDQLKLAAVMLAPSGDKALVEEASGKGYVITQGTYIGKNSGHVVDILLDRIIIEEIVKDLLGKSVVKRTEMMLQKTPGE